MKPMLCVTLRAFAHFLLYPQSALSNHAEWAAAVSTIKETYKVSVAVSGALKNAQLKWQELCLLPPEEALTRLMAVDPPLRRLLYALKGVEHERKGRGRLCALFEKLAADILAYTGVAARINRVQAAPPGDEKKGWRGSAQRRKQRGLAQVDIEPAVEPTRSKDELTGAFAFTAVVAFAVEQARVLMSVIAAPAQPSSLLLPPSILPVSSPLPVSTVTSSPPRTPMAGQGKMLTRSMTSNVFSASIGAGLTGLAGIDAISAQGLVRTSPLLVCVSTFFVVVCDVATI
jgi:hypothetical protein